MAEEKEAVSRRVALKVIKLDTGTKTVIARFEAERIRNRFKDQPLQEAEVRETIGYALQEVGESEQSIQYLQRAYEVHGAELGPGRRDTLASQENLAVAYAKAGRRCFTPRPGVLAP